MHVEMLQVTTRDGVRLHGMYQQAHDAIDIAICVHGTGSNFYSASLFHDLSAMLLANGISVLRVNTRGHDLMTAHTGRRQGAAYEVVDDCRADLAAWIEFATGRGRLALIGHSLGAVKCLYAQALEPHPAVSVVAALSPPRLSYRWFRAEAASAFGMDYDRARALVDVGEGGTLLEGNFPLPFVTTAAGYVEKYGPDERYNYLTLLDRIRVPLLVTFGERELGNVAFRGGPEAVGTSARAEVLPEADHNYTLARPALGRCVIQWLRERVHERSGHTSRSDLPSAPG